MAIVWAQFLTIEMNRRARVGFSRNYDATVKKMGNFRALRTWISSHLKTFYVDLFRRINPTDLKHNDGKFFGGASDNALMLPML